MSSVSLHVDTDHQAHQSASRCVSCNAAVSGRYCSACGESTVVHMPSAGEFLHEFADHFVAVEGKLWKTLQWLIVRPGQLTVEFLKGRRVPFVAPLRLYLTMSLVFFALIKLFGIELPHLTIDSKSFGVSYSHSLPDPDRPGKLKTATAYLSAYDSDEASAGGIDMPFSISEMMTAVGRVNATWNGKVSKFLAEPNETKAKILNYGFLAYLPYMLIGALPLFALYLKVIYLRSGRRYGEHLVFALHANSFAFLVASLMILLPGSLGWTYMAHQIGKQSLLSVWDYLQAIPFVLLVVYLPIAMQRAYGGNRFATVARWLVLMTAHLLVIALCMVVAQMIGILGR